VDLLESVLAAYRMNGQICGREWPILAEGEIVSAIVLSPEEQSFDARFNGKYVTAAMARCEAEGLLMTLEALGKDSESLPSCQCQCHRPSAYVLFTSYASLESPLRCMDCFGPIALYYMEIMASGEFNELVTWQSDYRSCDQLQMNCSVLEQEATRELSSIDSSLNKIGLAHCKTLATTSNRPFYYYLFSGKSENLQTELERRCPGCGNAWLLTSRLHDLFDFRCDRCRLLSNIAFDVRWELFASEPDRMLEGTPTNAPKLT
jgi:predicted  nucleic acid-binding Zn ribbon protein